jgi:hypothetical protein
LGRVNLAQKQVLHRQFEFEALEPVQFAFRHFFLFFS